jgi:hypothetical protein
MEDSTAVDFQNVYLIAKMILSKRRRVMLMLVVSLLPFAEGFFIWRKYEGG